MPAEHTCAGCRRTFTGNHRVKDGEPYCRECEPLAPGHGAPTDGYEAPTTVDEYEASKRAVVDVGALMEGGDPR